MVELTKTSIKDFTTFISESVDKDIRLTLDRLAPKLSEAIKSTFDSSGARGGHDAWQVTSNPTPLVKTGHLRNSIEGHIDFSSDGYILVVGTDVDYAKKHNEGLEGLPQREFIFLTTDDERLVDEEIFYNTGAKPE